MPRTVSPSRPLRATLAVLGLALALGACSTSEDATSTSEGATAAAPSMPPAGGEAASGPAGADEEAPSPAPGPPPPAPTASGAPPEPQGEQLPAGVTDEALLPGDPALLALGDSLSAGTGLVRSRDGFVWRVHHALAEGDGGYGLANLAVPGATSASLVEEGQLAAAEQVLAARQVDTVLVSVGGNDLLGLLRGPCGQGLSTPGCTTAVDLAVAGYATNLDAILGRLRAAASDVDVVLLQLYNPFDIGLGSEAEARAAEATLALNLAAEEVAARHDVLLADGYGALQGRITTTTGMGGQQPDVHPNVRGHDLLAVAILDALGR